VQFGIYGTPWGIPAKVIDFVLPGSVALVIWQWGRLGWQARGLILAAYGVFILGSFLPPALRSRERQKRGAQAQGSVVGVVQETNDEGDRFYHPGCASSRRTVGRWNSRPPSATASSPKSAPRCRFATSRRSPAGRRGQRRHLATARSNWLTVRAGAAGGRGRRVHAGIGVGTGLRSSPLGAAVVLQLGAGLRARRHRPDQEAARGAAPEGRAATRAGPCPRGRARGRRRHHDDPHPMVDPGLEPRSADVRSGS
jgi:hypothetical protein